MMEGIQDRGVEIISELPAVALKNLSFSFPLTEDSIKNQLSKTPILNEITLDIPYAARVLVVGMNGSGRLILLSFNTTFFNHSTMLGKSTLLNCLAGKSFVGGDAIKVMGKNPFYDTSSNDQIRYIKPNEWAIAEYSQPPFSSVKGNLSVDLSVGEMMSSIQNEYKSRRDRLVDILQINLLWRMNRLFDHERKKVALFLNLIKPFEILLLDESLCTLDIIIRKNLLEWLKIESEERGCTILYATQVISDLNQWPTHIIYLQLDGAIGWFGSLSSLYEGQKHPKDRILNLQSICEEWFKDELGAIRVQIFSRSNSLNEETKRDEKLDHAVAESLLQSNRKKGLPIDAEYKASMNKSNH